MSEVRRPTLCIVAGPNGSGKTTTTLQLLDSEWSDDGQIFKQYTEDVPEWAESLVK